VVAIPTGIEDDDLYNYLCSERITTFRGNLNDVFSRFEDVISNTAAEVIIRSTADCPLFMSEILDLMLDEFETTDLDYLSNAILPTYPDGLDIEIFTRDAFLSLANSELTLMQREHVTLGFYDGTHDFKIKNFENSKDLSFERWTVDYQEDFDFISEVFIKTHKHVSFTGVLDFLRENPVIRNAKPSTFRNISLEKGLYDEES
jgi:spore coat polysaccharide biosynthesis protein SpsF (cytidylyltransferase family)